MKRIIITLFLTLSPVITSSIFSQKIFIDEYMQKIDSLTFQKKCKAAVLKCLSYKKDSIFDVNKIMFKYSFGKITSTEVSQIKKVLEKSGTKKINNHSNIIIHYRDSLYSFEASLRNYKRYIKKHPDNKLSKFTLKSFDSSREKWVKKQKKCIKKINSKFDTDTFYIYNHKYIDLNNFYNFKWIKDRGIFKDRFFNIIYNNQILIIKPDGNYFLSGGHLSKVMLFKLLKSSNWDKYKKDWQNSYTTLHKSGLGFFKAHRIHQSHCF